MSYFIGRLAQLKVSRVRTISHGYSFTTMAVAQPEAHSQITANCSAPLPLPPPEDQHDDQDLSSSSAEENFSDDLEKYRISSNVPRKDKADFLAKTLRSVGDSKEAVYGTLDAWVAWEESFPIAVIRRALNILEKEQEWHRIVQVIKWMLSKGQGTTMNTYGILILALDMDDRADEAHRFWDRKISPNLHSVPWQLCKRMIAIHYRNKDFVKLVKLFEELEIFNRKPPEKSIVMRVANAYELLGKVQEKERVLEKYSDLLAKDVRSSPENPKKRFYKKKKQGSEKKRV